MAIKLKKGGRNTSQCRRAWALESCLGHSRAWAQHLTPSRLHLLIYTQASRTLPPSRDCSANSKQIGLSTFLLTFSVSISYSQAIASDTKRSSGFPFYNTFFTFTILRTTYYTLFRYGVSLGQKTPTYHFVMTVFWEGRNVCVHTHTHADA